MFGLFKRKKKKKEQEQQRLLELEKQAKIEEDRRAEEAALEKEKRAKEAAKEAVIEQEQAKLDVVGVAPITNEPVVAKPVKKAPVKKAEEAPKINAEPKPKQPPKKETEEKKKPSGKYEIYPEAGMFKFRLKASNGEILAVSFGYASRNGAKAGITTFQKAVETGNFEISVDKAGFAHYDLFGSRKARVIMIGEFYKNEKLAESAVESVKRFYLTENIVDLDEIPASEVREFVVDKQKVDKNKNGKYELIKENARSYYIKLVANNGQVLLVSQNYASKQSALNGLEAIKNAIEAQNFTIAKDKQDRYQYNLYTSNNQLIVSGETYPAKQSCLSSIQSVLRFGDAELVE